jgi:DNA-binding transcriptional ArsR family regulator
MARPTNTLRHSVDRASEPAAPRPLVRSPRRGSVAPIRVELDARTAYDFVISLSEEAGATEDLLPADHDWLVAAHAELTAEAQETLRDAFAVELCLGVALLAIDRPEVRTAADLVALVEATSPVVIARTVFAEELQDPSLRPLIERALAGDQTVFETLTPKLSEWHPDERTNLLRRPEAYQRQILAVLRAWLPRFEQVEDRVAAMIRRDVDARAGDLAVMAPVDLIEKTTGGVRWLPEPGVRRVVLAPSYFARPYNYMLMGDDCRFLAYPLADGALDRADPFAPPLSVVRFHRALGDDTRLRILRLLVDRDWYLTELAQQLELSKPTVKHHLGQLRAAGLVTVTEGGQLMYWSLRRQRIEEACRELLDFLA